MTFILYIIVTIIVLFIDGWAPTRSPDEVIFRWSIGRVYLMEWLVYGLLAIYALDRLIGTRPLRQPAFFSPTPLDKPLSFFGFVMPAFALYGLLRGNPLQNAFGYWEWRSLFVAIVFYFLLTSILDTRLKAERLFGWFLGLCTVKATYYLALYLLGLPYLLEKIIGPGPIDEGPENVMFVFAGLAAVSLWFFRGEKRTRLQSFAPWAALVLAANLAISAKRTMQVGFILGLVILGFHLPWRRVLRYAGVAAVAAVLVAVLLGIGSSGSSATAVSASASRYSEIFQFIQDPSRLSDPGETVAFHVLDMLDVWGEIRQHPVMGSGFGSQYGRVLTLLPAVGGEELGEEAGMVHNQYLYLWWKTGVLGLVAFLYLIVSTLGFCKKAMPSVPPSEVEAIGLGLYAALWGDVFMEIWAPQWFTSTKVSFVIFMVIAIAVCFARKKEVRPEGGGIMRAKEAEI